MLRMRAPSTICGLAFDPCGGPNGSLAFATRAALYRLPLGEDGAEIMSRSGDAGAAAAPELLAGDPGEPGQADGGGGEARFFDISGLTIDFDGAVIVTDNLLRDVVEERQGPMPGQRQAGAGGQEAAAEPAITATEEITTIRRVDPNGTVISLAPDLHGSYGYPAILPNGFLALCHTRGGLLRFLDLGLKASPQSAPRSGVLAGRGPCASLSSAMGALLDRQPDGTADLTLVVGDRRFPVHRAILGARSPYFRQRLEGGFADGAAAELSLPDADPDAFALVLRWLYTGAVDIPPPLAPAVAELADRLLLPELCSDAQAVVLSGVSAETVVGCLLWAERLGGSFARLLSQLKAWCAEHGEEVVATAPESLEQLSARNPKLAAGLMADLLGRAGKRRRMS
ncbi:hypothetical protein HYH03_001901 [Edaphochlamys debaryana]|uniref:BTB domain-containing protein n=1 Tax=Edaphochlamys debaryana TaxID=47281 RepID=A0A835YCD0_9CHLO|nr:hypothetical protein HYH03_001901 [Edaphochlamys debaryana]|eukprot:KAG2500325.1 hypothetical protein HYH03_001901 [Edaphochlamys debaryana]